MHEKYECDHLIWSDSEPYKVVYSYTIRVKEFSCRWISQEDEQETSPVTSSKSASLLIQMLSH